MDKKHIQTSLITGKDGKDRCWWCGDDPLYVRYHDEEWGKPLHDDVRLFEKICLEGFQAGLSWLTILRKRENFRAAFDNFDFRKIATYSDNEINRLIQDKGIIRHKGKIEATINNACCAIRMMEEFDSLDSYFWSFKPEVQQSPPDNREELRAYCEESIALSKDLRNRGWKFVGKTTCYAFMQGVGMVNDHLASCYYQVVTGRPAP